MKEKVEKESRRGIKKSERKKNGKKFKRRKKSVEK